ncbi:MAG: hypothetical protein WC184_04690 [Acidimicrobiia bacterium]
MTNRVLGRENGSMAVRKDCRHYSLRTLANGEAVQRCRLGSNQTAPFACPEDCLFFERRPITGAGWQRYSPDSL